VNDCIFCKIIEKKIPSKIAYEDDKVIAFHDINPQAPVHILIVTKKHFDSIMDITGDDAIEIAHVFSVIQKLAVELGITEKGFRIVNNCGAEGGQTVPHVHFHLLAGRYMQWPPG